MVGGEDQGASIGLLLHLAQLRAKERQLMVGNARPAAAAARDDARILQGVAEQPDDAQERCVEGEVDPWLRRGRAVQGPGLGRDRRCGGAEVPCKGGQRRLGDIDARRRNESWLPGIAMIGAG